MIFLIPWGKMAFLFPKNMIFFLRTENERWSFSKNTRKYDIFCMLIKWYIFFLQIWNYTSVKKAKMIFSQKIHLKITFPALLKQMIFTPGKMILIDIPERVAMILYTFMETFLSVLIYCFPMKKNPGNLINRLEIWLYL